MISICRVNPADSGELTQIALSAKRSWGYPEQWMEVWQPQLTFDAEYFEANESWMAEVDAKPVAFYTLLDRGEVAWLDNLFVMPAYMNRGIGKALFQHAVELARLRGFKFLQLEADPNAAGFYEKMGMRKIAERIYDLIGQPRILPVMEMKI